MVSRNDSYTLVTQPPEFDFFPGVWTYNLQNDTIEIKPNLEDNKSKWYFTDKIVIGTTIINNDDLFILSYLRDPIKTNYKIWNYDTFYNNQRLNGIVGKIYDCTPENPIVKNIQGIEYNFILKDDKIYVEY